MPTTTKKARKNTQIGSLTAFLGKEAHTFSANWKEFTTLVPDTRNPRYAYLVKDGEISIEEMKTRLQKEESTKLLKKSIEANGGLVEPIFVARISESQFKILEGNRRWAAWCYLYESNATQWRLMPCYELPANMPLQTFKKMLAVLHIQGKRQWDVYSRAAGVRELVQSGVPSDEVAALCGIALSEVAFQAQTATLVDEYGTATGDANANSAYSPLYELAKNRRVRESKAAKAAVFRCLKDKELENTKSVRDIAQILEGRPDLVDRIVAGPANGGLSLQQARAEFASQNPASVKDGAFDLMSRTNTAITASFLQTSQALQAGKGVETITELLRLLNNLLASSGQSKAA